MLNVNEFDIKTGRTLTAYDPILQSRRPRCREIEHSYLEHWLNHHGLSECQLWLARLYSGVHAADQQRLEQEGKVLVFANGEIGYFTDAEMARLMTQGDVSRGIFPLYGNNRDLAHNLIAYGSLLVSGGLNSTILQSEAGPIKLLVIDEENQNCGSLPLVSRNSQSIEPERFERLLARLGDGTMLVNHSTVRAFASPAQQSSGQRLQSVSQFRAATPDAPGMFKGTLSGSDWVDELGVDAICSLSVIKGDGGQLSTPGLHLLSQLWLNRKRDARHSTQAVGSQLKGTIPDAIATELNPLVLTQAKKFSSIAGDVDQLADYYLRSQEVYGNLAQDPQTTIDDSNPDWLSQILQQDHYGVMVGGFPSVIDKLERFSRHERLEQALRGVRIPSAMAQPHGQLKPWEVCNRDLPEGALVAYYRSPVPNVSAVAIAINHPSALKQADPEAFQQHGVSYLNPWSARNIAITDFDGDVNAYFVGYRPVERNLPSWVREQLKATESMPPEAQYEAARQLFSELIQQLENNPEQASLRSADYPKIVAEFITRNDPARKPPEIVKQVKLKHPWRDNESLAKATWRAWFLTAENPIGRVANAGMVLQSFALECRYTRNNEAKETLLNQISSRYHQLLNGPEIGKLVIPDNASLHAKGLPAYYFRTRLQTLANAGPVLSKIQDVNQRKLHIVHHLKMAHDLLSDVANGPNASNLQTAVDAAKSARAIDEQLYGFAIALQYKPHLLRQHRKDPTVYTGDRPMPTNTDEPIGWMVEAVNQLYEEHSLHRADNVGMRFGSLMDGIEFNETQKRDAERIVTTYLKLMSERAEAQRQRHNDPTANQQPYLILTSVQSGRSLTVERLLDATKGNETLTQDLWRAAGATNWRVEIEATQENDPHRLNQLNRFIVKRSQNGKPMHLLGWVSEASAKQQQLSDFFQNRRHLRLDSPRVEVHPPRMLENDTEGLMHRTMKFLRESRDRIPPSEQAAYAAAMWSLKLPTGERFRSRSGQRVEKQAKLGMGVALQLFPEAVGDRLKQLPPLRLSGGRYRETTPAPGEHRIMTHLYQYLDKAGWIQQKVGVALVEPGGGLKHLGYLGDRTLPLPAGLTFKAEIAIHPALQASDSLSQISIQVKELLERNRLGRGQPRSVLGSYAPTYQELQDWWRAARAQKAADKLDAIGQLGQRLVECYRHELGSARASPPPNYRTLEVVLDLAECHAMTQAIKAMPQAVQPRSFQEPRRSQQGVER